MSVHFSARTQDSTKTRVRDSKPVGFFLEGSSKRLCGNFLFVVQSRLNQKLFEEFRGDGGTTTVSNFCVQAPDPDHPPLSIVMDTTPGLPCPRALRGQVVGLPNRYWVLGSLLYVQYSALNTSHLQSIPASVSHSGVFAGLGAHHSASEPTTCVVQSKFFCLPQVATRHPGGAHD